MVVFDRPFPTTAALAPLRSLPCAPSAGASASSGGRLGTDFIGSSGYNGRPLVGAAMYLRSDDPHQGLGWSRRPFRALVTGLPSLLPAAIALAMQAD
jgi:hypothetical protein